MLSEQEKTVLRQLAQAIAADMPGYYSDPKHRAELSTWRTIGATLAGLVIGVGTPLFAFETVKGNTVLSGPRMTVIAGVFSVLAVICYLLCFKLVRERVDVPANNQKLEIGKLLKSLVTNQSLLGIIAAAIALLLAQLADALAERGELPQIPEDIIAYRLSTLSQDERRVLELVAVFTSWAPFQALSAILRRDPLELTHLCCQLTQKKLLVESTREGGLEYSFTHERIKATVAQQQSESGRRLLHLRVARYLEDRLEAGQTAPYDQLIHHYTAGGDRFRTFRYRVLSLNAYAGLRYELMPTLTADPKTGLSGPDGLWEYFQTMRAELAGLRRFTPEQEELDRLRACVDNGLEALS